MYILWQWLHSINMCTVVCVQLSKTFCGLKIGWILRKLWVKMCVCSFDTFDMHRHYSPQLFWATLDTFDIQSITALIVYIELLSTPSTWVTLLCIEGPVCTFDTSDIHSLLILYWYYSSVSHLRHLQNAFWSFAHSAVFGTLDTSDIKESFDLQCRCRAITQSMVLV